MRYKLKCDTGVLPIVDDVNLDEFLNHVKSICVKGTKVIHKPSSRQYKVIDIVINWNGNIFVYLEDINTNSRELFELGYYLSRTFTRSNEWTFIKDDTEENKIVFPWDDESTELNEFEKIFFKENLKVDNLLYYQKIMLANMLRNNNKDV